MLELNKIYCGDVEELMMQLDENSVDVCITSPPYWGLRDYGIKGQIGLEEHPNQYIINLVRTFYWLKKALKKTGSFYLNIGDTFFANRDPKNRQWEGDGKTVGTRWARNPSVSRGGCKPDGSKWLQPKQLMLIPSRVAIALQEDGWILRNDIIWHKPNPMPSPVKDRLNTTYEHIFHFVKSKNYYYDLDAIREPHKESSFIRVNQNNGHPNFNGNKKRGHPHGQDTLDPQQFLHPKGKNPGDIVNYNGKFKDKMPHFQNVSERKNYQRQILGVPHDLATSHPLGKNPGDFWNITTKPFPEAHFAVFPPEILIKPLQSSCPDNGVVLDPFIGSGTVAYVCKYSGKFGIKKRLNHIGFEINPEYIKLANKRLQQETLLSLQETDEGEGGVFTQALENPISTSTSESEGGEGR